jgi:hypothetical protein
MLPLLDLLALAREFGALATVKKPLNTAEGIDEYGDALRAIAGKAAALTATKVDDELVAMLVKYSDLPEFNDLGAAMVRYVEAIKAKQGA